MESRDVPPPLEGINLSYLINWFECSVLFLVYGKWKAKAAELSEQMNKTNYVRNPVCNDSKKFADGKSRLQGIKNVSVNNPVCPWIFPTTVPIIITRKVFWQQSHSDTNDPSVSILVYFVLRTLPTTILVVTNQKLFYILGNVLADFCRSLFQWFSSHWRRFLTQVEKNYYY